MKAKGFIIISLVIVMVIMGAAPVKAQSESEDHLVKFYKSCIVKMILNCQAKTVLKTSRSENLRQESELATKQVTFLTSNKDILINEMIEQKIGLKEYKVKYYLNKRFYEMNP